MTLDVPAAATLDTEEPMGRYTEVITILDNLVAGKQIGAHGAFWRGKSRDQFVAQMVFGYPLLVIGNSTNSNIIRALSGAAPFGSDAGTRNSMFRRMPGGLPPASKSDIGMLPR
jgi:hypothetical protein